MKLYKLLSQAIDLPTTELASGYIIEKYLNGPLESTGNLISDIIASVPSSKIYEAVKEHETLELIEKHLAAEAIALHYGFKSSQWIDAPKHYRYDELVAWLKLRNI